MPVRFQVDADFYDHDKTLGMSDAATALWVRAGSYSAAKLLDGFVPDAMLARLSETPAKAAQELVKRKLWRRVRGGYQFHDWEERGNLTRARVEADRKADRERKKAQRAGIGKASGNSRDSKEQTKRRASRNANGQVEAHNVRPDSEPDSEGTPEGFRSLSVSVSESVSSPPEAPLVTEADMPPEQPRRKRRTTRLPKDFEPTEEHIRRARDCGLDIAWELEKFRTHAEANDRRQASWNGAFTQWLQHAVEFRRQRQSQQQGPSGWWDN